MSVDPLHFIRTYSFLGTHLDRAVKDMSAYTQPSSLTLILALAALGSFFVFHFILSWVVIGRVAYQGGLRSVFRSPLAVYSLAAVFAGVAIALTYSIAGGAVYYFSNIAFFVSLPGVIVLAVTLLVRSGFDHRRILIVGVFLISLLGLKGFYHASALVSYRAGHQASELIHQLQQMRTNASKQIVWRKNLQVQTINPVERCTAQPFLYPAVSERPWTDVVAEGNKAPCAYNGYLYEQYGITALDKHISKPPKLLPGMTIQMAQ